MPTMPRPLHAQTAEPMRGLRKLVMGVYERALARSGPAAQPAAEEASAQPVERKRKRKRASVGTTCICCDLHGLP